MKMKIEDGIWDIGRKIKIKMKMKIEDGIWNMGYGRKGVRLRLRLRLS